MSTILKALRRLEEDERAQAPVSLDEALLESPARERHGLRVGTALATVSAALVGVIAVAWSLSGLWLPGSESLPESLPLDPAATQESAAPEVQVVQSQAANPPPVPELVVVVPASPPLQARVKVFPNPDEIRREMQRLVGGAIQRAEQQAAETAAEAESAARPEGVEEVSDPKPAVAPVAKKPQEFVVAHVPLEVAKAPSAPVPELSLPESMPVEIQPPAAEFVVQEIIWHPNPARRIVVVRIDEATSRRLGEGDENSGFKVVEIGLSEVELLHGGAVLRRGMAAN